MNQLALINLSVIVILIGLFGDASGGWSADEILNNVLGKPMERLQKITEFGQLAKAYNDLNNHLESHVTVDDPEINFAATKELIKTLPNIKNQDKKIKFLRKAYVQFNALGEKDAKHDVCSKEAKNVLIDNDSGTGGWLRHAHANSVRMTRVERVIHQIAKQQAATCREHYFNIYKRKAEEIMANAEKLQLHLIESFVNDLLKNYLDTKHDIVKHYDLDKNTVFQDRPYLAARIASSMKFKKPTKAQLQILHNYLIKRMFAKNDLAVAEMNFRATIIRMKRFDVLKYKRAALTFIATPCEFLIEKLAEAYEQANFPPVNNDLRYDPNDQQKFEYYRHMVLYQVCKHLNYSRDKVFQDMSNYVASSYKY